MKNIIILIFSLFITVTIYGQEFKTKFEKQKDLLKATYYYHNGNIKQIGYFHKNKLHGNWVSFDKKGKKTTLAYFEKGKKIGTWLILNEGVVKQVTFDANKLIDVKFTKLVCI